MSEPAAERWYVAQWMTARPITTRPEAIALDAAEVMHEHRIRHLPVVDGDRVVGMISDRDLRRLLPAKGKRGAVANAPDATLVRDLMTALPFSITTSASLREAAELICREKIGALPVLEHGKLMGIISSEDLLWAYLENTADAEFKNEAEED